MELFLAIVLMILGLVMLIKGSDVFIDVGTRIGKMFKMSEILIGLTIVCIGTSLPELLLSISASLNGTSDFLIGNIVGTNIFNICVVLGLPITIFGTVSSPAFNLVDLVIVLLAALLLFLFGRTDKELSRREGIIMVLTVIVYYAYIFIY